MRKGIKYTTILLIYFGLGCSISCSPNIEEISNKGVSPPFQKYLHSQWVDSMMSHLSLEEQIGQLIWVPVRTAGGSEKKIKGHERVLKQILNNKVGGVIYARSDLEYILSSLKEFQSNSKVPLIAALTGEWGVAMRLAGAPRFPYAMTLGAISNDSLLYEVGAMMAEQTKLIGLHVNFAAVADVNVEPNNPVIGKRSFGENPQRVSGKAWAVTKGMQDRGVMVSLKHFPGHGDTDKDSHKALPTLYHDSAQLFSVDIKPYTDAIPQGLAGIMIAHLYIPSLMGSQESAVTFHKPLITGVLKEQLNFQGLIISDAMEMQGAQKLSKTPGDVDAMALQAGCDVIELPIDVDAAVAEVKRYVDSGWITSKEIAEKCRKVLAVKQWVGLSEGRRMPQQTSKEIWKAIHSPKMQRLNTRLYEEAITLLQNENETLPLREHLSKESIALLNLGVIKETIFEKNLEKEIDLDVFYMRKSMSVQQRIEMRKRLQGYDKVIVAIYNTLATPYSQLFPKSENKFSYGVTSEMVTLVNDLSTSRLILVHFGIPYSMQHFTKLHQAGSVLMAYEETDLVETIAAQVLMGQKSPKGRLPVSIGRLYQEGDGLTYKVKQ